MTLPKARRAKMGNRVLAHLDPDPVPPHLVGDRRGRARAEEGVEHEVARVGGE